MLSQVSLHVASAIYGTGKMSKLIYTDIRLLMKSTGHDVLPPYINLLAFREEHRPAVEKIVSRWGKWGVFDRAFTKSLIIRDF